MKSELLRYIRATQQHNSTNNRNTRTYYTYTYTYTYNNDTYIR